MKRLLIIAAALMALCFQMSAQDRLYDNEFPIGDVKLLDGPFKHARDLNVEVLLQYDVDRLLAPFRAEAGLPKKAEYYPNWAGLDGHIAGHYLTAMAMNWQTTGNPECLRRMNYMIDELAEVAAANARNNASWGVGYIGGIPNSASMWTDFKKGEFRQYSSAWAPFYNIHKMYAGLRDAWLYCGNEKAKELFLGFCDWGINITADLSDAQMEEMMRNEQGGMNEMFADAYAMTGDEKYLTAAKRYSHKLILEPLARDEDRLDNLHANTQVPKAVGFVRIGELSDSPDYAEAGRYFWWTVSHNRSLAFGGNSRREHFPSAAACIDFVNDDDGPETCNSYNMLKLTEDLFRVSPKAEYADFYERTMFNHILSTQHPEHGGYVYFTSARPRHYRVYSVPNEAMWCCVGSGMENQSKYNQFIYTHEGNDLYVNLFVASELNWKDRKLVVRQETQFPSEESTKLRIVSGKGRFAINVRYPGWVEAGALTVKVNGKPVKVEAAPSSYVSLNRKWKKGDVIEVGLPMRNTIEHMPNVPEYVAIMHGPILLGMRTGTEDLVGLLADDGRWSQYAAGPKLPVDQAPILVCHTDVDHIGDFIRPVPGEPLHFRFDGVDMLNPIYAELEPFSGIHDSRYQIYWLALNDAGYKDYVEELARKEAEMLALEARTLDHVTPGEQQPETDHKIESQRSNTGVTRDVHYRDARSGGWFSYDLATGGLSDGVSLYVKYWGAAEWATRKFDIFVDDELMLSVDNTGKWMQSQFIGEEYPVPAAMLKGKDSVRVKFVAQQGATVGGVYDLRLLKRP
ncbi:MAG: glycoside hydrolase family 127 protein [Bacteroidales bacterium]|nr:glycoside hydrolase family 127 protein [Bacteroidales bacterium]